MKVFFFFNVSAVFFKLCYCSYVVSLFLLEFMFDPIDPESRICKTSKHVNTKME